MIQPTPLARYRQAMAAHRNNRPPFQSVVQSRFPATTKPLLVHAVVVRHCIPVQNRPEVGMCMTARVSLTGNLTEYMPLSTLNMKKDKKSRGAYHTIPVVHWQPPLQLWLNRHLVYIRKNMTSASCYQLLIRIGLDASPLTCRIFCAPCGYIPHRRAVVSPYEHISATRNSLHGV